MLKYVLIFGLFMGLLSCEKKVGITSLNSNIQNVKQISHIKTDTIAEKEYKYLSFNDSIDSLPQEFRKFIPKNYSVIELSSGDVNLDKIEDKILILKKNNEENTSNYSEGKPDKRPFLLLLGQKDKTYKLACRNDNAIYCIDYGLNDPSINIFIKKGYFLIKHSFAGGPEHWGRTFIFQYNKKKNDWFVSKMNVLSYNFELDKEIIISKQTPKDFGIISFKDFNIYKSDWDE